MTEMRKGWILSALFFLFVFEQASGLSFMDGQLSLYGQVDAIGQWVSVPNLVSPYPKRIDSYSTALSGLAGVNWGAETLPIALDLSGGIRRKKEITPYLRTATLSFSQSVISLVIGKQQTAWGEGLFVHPTFFLSYQKGVSYAATGKKEAPFLWGIGVDWFVGHHLITLKGFMDEAFEKGARPVWGGGVVIDRILFGKGEVLCDFGYLYHHDEGLPHRINMGIEGSYAVGTGGLILFAAYNHEIRTQKGNQVEQVPRATLGGRYSFIERGHFTFEFSYQEDWYAGCLYTRDYKNGAVMVVFRENLSELRTYASLRIMYVLEEQFDLGGRLYYEGSDNEEAVVGVAFSVTLSL